MWSPLDLLDAFRQLSPEQLIYASDYPYGQQPASLLIALRTARQAGLDDARVREMLAGGANRIAAGEPPLEPTSPTAGETFSQPMVFARIHQYLSMATPLLWLRQADTIGVLGLALNTAQEQNGYPDDLDRIRELLTAARDLWATLGDAGDEAEQRQLSRVTFRLIHLADIWAVTAGA